MPNDDWTFGVSAAHLRGREDFDWNAFARTELPDATFVRLWIRRVLSDRTEISLRIENIFGEDAPPAAFGFPAVLRADARIKRGVIAMHHAWGVAPDDESVSYVRSVGTNTNRLIDNSLHRQRYTGMTRQSAIPVYLSARPETP